MSRSFRLFISLSREIVQNRYLIVSLARRQIRTQFVGSFLGLIWTFIKPLTMIGIYWFVFSIGLKSQPLGNIPFVVWFCAGLAIWSAFSDIVTNSVNVIVENQGLIKKTTIKPHILHIAKIAAAIIPHSFFLLILVTLILFCRLPFSLYYLQFLYYFFAMCVLALGLAWLLSAINVFIRDTASVVEISIQLFFWLTPIVWGIDIMPENYHFYLKMNPLYYLIQGYRDSFFYFVPFWEHPVLTFYYWAVTLLVFITGGLFFRKAKIHFADML